MLALAAMHYFLFHPYTLPAPDLKTQRRLLIAGVIMAMLLLLAGCSPETPKLAPKPDVKREFVRDLGNKTTFNPAVDILFVVDDSASMGPHQKRLSDNVRLFTEEFHHNQILDFHIGVITSSLEDFYGGGRLVGEPNFISNSTPDGIAYLAKNMMPGIAGSSIEVFFDTVYKALNPPFLNGVNKGFYRHDAHLAVIFITDTEDQSRILSPDDYFSFLLKLKNGDATKILTYAAYVSARDTCPRDDPQRGRIDRVLELGHGISFSLCAPDFGSKLAGLSVDLVDKVGRTIPVSKAPDVSTVTVKYGTQVIPNDPLAGWTYDPRRGAIVLGRQLVYTQQPSGTQLEVNFAAAAY